MKKGISLVALIVTIIVLIIISGAAIINTMNNNVLDNSKNAVNEYNRKVLIEHINISMQDEKTAKVIKGETGELSTAEIIDILKKYGEFNNNNLKLSTSSNTDIWLYDIVPIPIEEYVTIEYVNNTLSIETELLEDLYNLEYTLDNGINWETYELKNGVEISEESGIKVRLTKDEKVVSNIVTITEGYNNIPPVIVEEPIQDNVLPEISVIVQEENDLFKISVELSDNENIDLTKSRYILSKSNVSLGNDLAEYADEKFFYETEEIGVKLFGDYYFHVIATDTSGNISTYVSEVISGNNLEYAVLSYPTVFNYTGEEQSVILSEGIYIFEACGAQGGSPDDTGGKGAYTKGIINIEDEENIYVYVGGKANVFNGGGKLNNVNSIYCGAGGGATDFRLINGTWNNADSLRSRIMVAAGGGGNSFYDSGSTAGVGGTLTGENGKPHSSCAGYNGLGATQTAGGARHSSTSGVNPYGTAGAFGTGGSAGIYYDGHQGAGGGGGYYGGGGSAWHAGAGGGSSFISGYAGCNAVNEEGIHTGSSVHYSNYIFNNSEMVTGVNEGNGYAEITKYNNGYKYIYKSVPIITVDISSANSLYTVNVNLNDNENIDLTKSKYVLSNSNLSLGTNLSNYTDGTFINTTQEFQIGVFGEYYLHIITTDNDGNVTTYVSEVLQGHNVNYGSFIAQTEYNCIDDVQSALLTTGIYKFEAWGAQGGSYGKAGGKGGYTSGIINISIDTPIYIYVGRCGDGLTTKTFNGGGSSANQYNARSGGGATDFRLIDGDWDNDESLKSRIMVAAGGGGSDYFEGGSNGGAGGGLIGIDGGYRMTYSFPYTVSKGGTQTSGGIGANGESAGGSGTFGVGGSSTNNHGGGGGGGYYGGGSGSYNNSVVGSGAGGSSFISGYLGCDAIDDSGIHTGDCMHYSGNVFIYTEMIGGNRNGNGLAKITQYNYGYMYID